MNPAAQILEALTHRVRLFLKVRAQRIEPLAARQYELMRIIRPQAGLVDSLAGMLPVLVKLLL